MHWLKKKKTTLNLRNEMWKYLVFFNYSAGPDYRRRVRVSDGNDDSIRDTWKRDTRDHLRSFCLCIQPWWQCGSYLCCFVHRSTSSCFNQAHLAVAACYKCSPPHVIYTDVEDWINLKWFSFYFSNSVQGSFVFLFDCPVSPKPLFKLSKIVLGKIHSGQTIQK